MLYGPDRAHLVQQLRWGNILTLHPAQRSTGMFALAYTALKQHYVLLSHIGLSALLMVQM